MKKAIAYQNSDSATPDPFEVEILNLLERPVAFTPAELGYLAQIEQRHGIAKA